MPALALVPAAISLILISTSIPLVLEPVSFPAHTIQIETTQAAFYARQIGARNLLLGMALGALTYQGLQSGAATVLCCFLLLGVLDPWAGYMYRGRIVGNDWTHLLVGSAFGGAG